MVNATKLYGVDLKLENRDLVLSSSGGFQASSGNDNVIQAVNNLLTTESGSLAYDRTYGADLNLVIGEKNSYLKQQLIKSLILSALKNEPRVSYVDSITVLQDTVRPDTFTIELKIVPIASEQEALTINLVYPFYLNQSNLKVENEAQEATDKTTVPTTYNIYSVDGVWLATDMGHTGVNFYGTTGRFTSKTVYLDYELPAVDTAVIVSYNKKIETDSGGNL